MPERSSSASVKRDKPAQDVQPAAVDDVDRRILNVLHDDARIPNSALAEIVGIAPSTCHGRVRRLQDLGVIRGFYTDVDPAAIGRPLQAMTCLESVIAFTVTCSRSTDEST